MSELFSLLPGCFFIAVIIISLLYFYRQRQNKNTAAFEEAAGLAGQQVIDDEQALTALQTQLAQFAFGQRGGKTIIQSAIQAHQGVVLYLLQTRAAPGSDSDRYLAYLVDFSGPAADLQMVLRVRSTLFDNALNRALYGSSEEIPLSKWLDLAQTYVCLGQDRDRITALLEKGMGGWMAAEARASRLRNLELSDGRLLIYELAAQTPGRAQIGDLTQSGQRILALLN